ncbi:MAG: hypothetical protein HUJ63_09620, partial [Enterococcus sp.]|nr:hypothetical protein [Enterococcus sp.]
MGVDIYEDLLIIQKKCSNILDVEKKKYAKLPYGTLSVKKGNEYYCFYRRMPNSIVGIKKNPQLLRQLIQKKFLKSNLDYLEFASKEINKTVRALAPAYRKSQIPPLSDEVIKSANLSPDELHYTEEQFAWMSEKWPSNTKHPEQLIYTTKRGL